LVVGKCNSIVNWTEYTVEGFRRAGCEVDYFAVNGRNRAHSLYYKMLGAFEGDKIKVVAHQLRRKLQEFQPDLVVYVMIASNWMSGYPFEVAQETCPNAIKVAWVGDKFTRTEGVFAEYMDWVFCTDSYFMDQMREHGFAAPASYLPLALDPQVFRPMAVPRTDKIVYVANNTPGRGQFVGSVEKPLTLYGRGWSKLKETPHEIHAYRLPLSKLPTVYASSRAVLNVKNEKNVVRGLSQRTFEPYGCMTPVLNDDMADVDRCFEPGKEILIYRSLEELHDLHDRLTADPVFAKSLGAAGYKRVMAEHTYEQRALAMLRQVGLGRASA
jgi:spore maturation protein CgeB